MSEYEGINDEMDLEWMSLLVCTYGVRSNSRYFMTQPVIARKSHEELPQFEVISGWGTCSFSAPHRGSAPRRREVLALFEDCCQSTSGLEGMGRREIVLHFQCSKCFDLCQHTCRMKRPLGLMTTMRTERCMAAMILMPDARLGPGSGLARDEMKGRNKQRCRVDRKKGFVLNK